MVNTFKPLFFSLALLVSPWCIKADKEEKQEHRTLGQKISNVAQTAKEKVADTAEYVGDKTKAFYDKATNGIRYKMAEAEDKRADKKKEERDAQRAAREKMRREQQEKEARAQQQARNTEKHIQEKQEKYAKELNMKDNREKNRGSYPEIRSHESEIARSIKQGADLGKDTRALGEHIKDKAVESSPEKMPVQKVEREEQPTFKESLKQKIHDARHRIAQVIEPEDKKDPDYR